MLTTVDLVRHAHADWTPDENRPLSSRGRVDALTLARRLAEPAIAAIYSSPARRAIETIEPLAWACGVQPTRPSGGMGASGSCSPPTGTCWRWC